MTGLLLKDLLNLKRMAKQYLLILAAMVIWAFFMKNALVVSMYLVLCSSMLVLTSFSYDEYAHFEKYALTMPIAKRTLVQEKYLLLLLLTGGGTVAGLLAGGVMTFFLKESVAEMLVSGLVIGCAFLIVYSCVIPVIFKVGVEKARMTMIGIYLLIFVLIYGFAKLMKLTDTAVAPDSLEWLIPLGAVAVTILAAVSSYLVSLKIIEKKEW